MHFIAGFNLVFEIIYNVLIYGLCGYGLYKIGTRCNVKNSWVAWVPVFQYYIIGSICEEYEFFGFRIKKLEWVLCGAELLRIACGFASVFGASVISFAITLFMAMILHKFFYLFEPKRAVLYGVLCILGKLPMAIILFIIRDNPMQMSAAAFDYPFKKK